MSSILVRECSFHMGFKWLQPVLVWFIGKCMVSTININYGIKKPSPGYQKCNTSQELIFGGYVEVSESMYPNYYLGLYYCEPY